MEKRNIDRISVITTSLCNLNCSFCYLNKNESYKVFDKQIQEAWKNGSYVQNIKKTLLSVGSELNQLKSIDLWGGETLLQLENFNINIPELYYIFPNLQHFAISSNWMIDINKVIEFIELIEQNANQLTDIKLQMSIDGPPGEIMEQGHQGNWDTYYNNCKTIIDYFNTHKLKKVKLDFLIKSTVNKSLYLKYFKTVEGMKNYFQWFYDFVNQLRELCISPCVNVLLDGSFPSYSLPYNGTVEEGLELAYINSLWEFVRANYFPNINYNLGWYYGISSLIPGAEKHTPNQECQELKNALTILPDGTICQCSSSFMEHQNIYRQELLDTGDLKNYQLTQYFKQQSYNPQLLDQEGKENVDWYVTHGTKNNNSTFLHITMITCDELAMAGQIPYYFHLNPQYLYETALNLASVHSCMRENLKDTGNIFLSNISYFREHLNGLIQYIQNMYNSIGLNKVKKNASITTREQFFII